MLESNLVSTRNSMSGFVKFMLCNKQTKSELIIVLDIIN